MIEVAIVGGGIAAAAAVLELRKKGRSLCVMAPESQCGSDKIGESLSPAANQTLQKLGVWDAFCKLGNRESQSSYSAWGMSQISERNAFGNLDGAGWQINRSEFEALLWEHAPHRRVSSVLNHTEHDGKRWKLTTKDGEKIEAAFVLDCSGRASVVGRCFFPRLRVDRQLAAYTFLTQKDGGITPTPGSMIESRADGWWYSALLPDDRMVVTQFFDADLIDRGIHREESAWLEAVSETEFTEMRIRTAGYAVEGLPTLIDASTTWLEKAAGDYWVAAGDAAAAFDPLSSHGMATALWSGRASGRAIDRVLSGDPDGLVEYSIQMQSGVRSFLKQRQKIYGMEQRFREEAFWQRRHREI
jgi:2-polyprenyl-6-methoxyphenol hydroxylase-like FAD-dependent oxidoreductase